MPKKSKWYGWLAAILIVSLGLQVLLMGCEPSAPVPIMDEKPIKSFDDLMSEMKELRKDGERIKELQRQYHKGTLKSA
jgi:hypothetical protein